MVLGHLKKGIKIGMKAAHMSAKQLEKELKPLVSAGHITINDAKIVASEAKKLGMKVRSKAVAAAKLEAKHIIGKMGYMSKADGDALKKRIAELERKLKAGKKPKSKPKKK